MKGRCYNVSPEYDTRAQQCLSKAVKLNPHLIGAWNELGECYWKNMNVKEARASFEGALKHVSYYYVTLNIELFLSARPGLWMCKTMILHVVNVYYL